ncbi:thioredoxin domain-containing protein 17-like [Vanessa tameamea]|uniref:Thioredoxin domain-containing protein 17 n=1 Tax=Vanessa tameamea TaxID=334116 RepID=A0A8B8HYF6_VANTA|nr:thioredoxin domain-containing protein 17-like [Vanessa tameamea]XP_026489894.1 thioredoxin domain-containing protein 17-like [Vanessa tameamea]
MVTQIEIKGFDEFVKYTETIDDNGPPVLFYFSGSKLPDGNSWCPDCVVAEPMVKAFVSELNKNIIFVYVSVGDREYWKDRACPFRTDSRLKLMVIPTIIKWKGVQRLEGSQCGQRDLLQMLFEDDD